jgi:hypothetical protein
LKYWGADIKTSFLLQYWSQTNKVNENEFGTVPKGENKRVLLLKEWTQAIGGGRKIMRKFSLPARRGRKWNKRGTHQTQADCIISFSFLCVLFKAKKAGALSRAHSVERTEGVSAPSFIFPQVNSSMISIFAEPPPPSPLYSARSALFIYLLLRGAANARAGQIASSTLRWKERMRKEKKRERILRIIICGRSVFFVSGVRLIISCMPSHDRTQHLRPFCKERS